MSAKRAPEGFNATAATADLETELQLLDDTERAESVQEIELRGRVVRGLAPRDQLTELERRRVERSLQRSTLVGLLKQARELATLEAQRATLIAYDDAVDQAEASFAAAAEDLEAIDAAINVLRERVPRMRQHLDWSALRHEAQRINDRLLQTLHNTDRRNEIGARILRRLQSVGVVPANPGEHPTDGPVAGWVRGWTHRLVTLARRGRVYVDAPPGPGVDLETEDADV